MFCFLHLDNHISFIYHDKKSDRSTKILIDELNAVHFDTFDIFDTALKRDESDLSSEAPRSRLRATISYYFIASSHIPEIKVCPVSLILPISLQKNPRKCTR